MKPMIPSPAWPTVTAGWALAAVLALPLSAWGDVVADAALNASEVTQTWCANLSSRKADEIVKANKFVGDGLDAIHAAYEETKDASLLYWRGQLAQYLERKELAISDFEAFVASQGQQSMYAYMVKDANSRLNRLRGKKRREGPAAEWLRRPFRVEGRLDVGGGLSIRLMNCADNGNIGTGGRAVNAACLGGPNARTLASASLAGEGRGGVDLYLGTAGSGKGQGGTRVDLGFGTKGRLGMMSRGALVEPHTTNLPHGNIGLGFRLRARQAANAGKSAWSLRLSFEFATTFTPLIPWTGSAKYPEIGLLDPGTWMISAFGGGFAMRLEVETTERQVLEIGLEGLVTKAPLPMVRKVRDGGPRWVDPRQADEAATVDGVSGCDDAQAHAGLRCEGVSAIPELRGASRWRAKLQVALLRPMSNPGVALGPFVGVGCGAAEMDVTDHDGNDWSVPQGSTDDVARRRMFSTRLTEVATRAGLTGRFGGGRL